MEDERRGYGEGEDGAATNWEVDVSERLRDDEWLEVKDFVLDMFRGNVARGLLVKRILRPHVSSLRTRLSPVVVRSGSKFQRRRA